MCRADLAAIVAVLALAGCVTDRSPSGWLPTARQSQQSTQGGWVAVDCKGAERCAEGELIAVSPDAVEVLTRDGFVAVSAANIEEATLADYHSQHHDLEAWMGAGALSTVSHGVYAVVSAPVWLITGMTAKEFERRAALRHYPDVALAGFAPFARFPQGRPASVDPKSLGRLRSVSAEQMPAETLPSPPAPAPPPAPAQPPPAVFADGQSAKLRAGAQLHSQPKRASTAEPSDPAAILVLKASVYNEDGHWWYVTAGARSAWVLETDLSPN